MLKLQLAANQRRLSLIPNSYYNNIAIMLLIKMFCILTHTFCKMYLDTK